MKKPVSSQKYDASLTADNIVICKNPVKVIQTALKKQSFRKDKEFYVGLLNQAFFPFGDR